MKLSKRTVNDLLNLLEHTRQDINYDSEGTYGIDTGSGDKVDTKAVKSSERALQFITHILRHKDTFDIYSK